MLLCCGKLGLAGRSHDIKILGAYRTLIEGLERGDMQCGQSLSDQDIIGLVILPREAVQDKTGLLVVFQQNEIERLMKPGHVGELRVLRKSQRSSLLNMDQGQPEVA